MTHVVTRGGIEYDLSYNHKAPCYACRRQSRDRSADNMVIYGLDSDGRHLGGHCFACSATIPSEQWLEENSDDYEKEQEEEEVVGSEFNKDIYQKILQTTGTDPKGYRGIRKDTSEVFKVRYQYSEEDGSVERTLYPTTKDGKMAGYKSRRHPKDFSQPIGETGLACEMFGQVAFKTFNHTLCVTEGEHDAMAAYQMLSDAQRNKNYDPVACVSCTTGGASTYKQLKSNYEFFNQFKKVVVCMDADKAGEKDAQKIVESLPRGKIYILKMRYNDPNQYIDKGKEQEFISDFWAAKLATSAGIHASSNLLEAAIEYSDIKQLSLPKFFRRAQEMFNGGLVKNEITTFFAPTSIGKSTITEALTAHWIMNEPDEVVGVMSLEAACPKYATSILSSHLGVRLNKMAGEDRKTYLRSPTVVERVNSFLNREDGSARFFVLDERGADIEVIKEKVLEMIIHLGVTILIVDPASDLADGMSLDEQEKTISWFKKLNKEYPSVTPIFVAHTRKTKAGEALTESDIMGSSTLMKSSGQTISLERDKLNPNPALRNCTQVRVHKNRHFGETGDAGVVYFDIDTSTLWDRDDYIDTYPEMANIFDEQLEDEDDKPLNSFGKGERF